MRQEHPVQTHHCQVRVVPATGGEGHPCLPGLTPIFPQIALVVQPTFQGTADPTPVRRTSQQGVDTEEVDGMVASPLLLAVIFRTCPGR
jgi:hypothetical protein